MTINRADVAACLDVVNQLMAEVDDLPADEALRFKADVEALGKAAADTRSLLETRAITLIEKQPIVVDNAVYATQTSGKWRPNHVAIKDMILDAAMDAATDRETGDINPIRAVRRAIELAFKGFVAPAKMPTQGFLSELGQSNKTTSTWEAGRKELVKKDLKVVDDDA